MNKSYIGITGFKTIGEVRQAGQIFACEGFLGRDSRLGAYKPMFGIAASNKRLADRAKGGTMSPSADNLVSLLRGVPGGCMPVMHYSTENRGKLADELAELFSIGRMYGEHCSAVQINMDWPELRQVEAIKKAMPEMVMIFQIPQRAMQAYTKNSGLDIESIAAKANEYAGFADYMLVDPSGGKGKEFDVGQCTGLMLALGQKLPNTRIGVAGGFSGGNVLEKMQKLHERVSEPFCIDAQGRLRTEDREWLVMEKVQSYVCRAAEAIRGF
ncbi:MAG TPA: hypothetical protein HA362_02325 [Nanoarchaeota archaeon]|nr:hypothetical protein [Nanoarchaeota archaeon]